MEDVLMRVYVFVLEITDNHHISRAVAADITVGNGPFGVAPTAHYACILFHVRVYIIDVSSDFQPTPPAV
jgi:hypothetical protein